MKKKKAVTKDVQKPPPVKKSPNGIGKGRSHHKKKGANGVGRPWKYDPDTVVDPESVSKLEKAAVYCHNSRVRKRKMRKKASKANGSKSGLSR